MEQIRSAERVVLKIGTQVIVDPSGQLSFARLEEILKQVVALKTQGREVLIVSSGAVALGRGLLGKKGDLSVQEKQACASVGQSQLIEAYQRILGKANLVVSQLLLTDGDFAHRRSYLSLSATLSTLLEWGVVPIINENDPVSKNELSETGQKSFGDNDKLSAIVASKLGADLLVILTNVDGVFDRPPSEPGAVLCRNIQSVSALNKIDAKGQSEFGRGGMKTKLEAGRICSLSGVQTLILNGMKPERIADWTTGKDDAPVGTWVHATPGMSSRKRWIGLASGFEGVLVLNAGAIAALRTRKSLLAVGVTEVRGKFKAGQVLSLQNEQGLEIGRGLAEINDTDVKAMIGQKKQVVIHADDLAVYQEDTDDGETK
ncbi:MAG: glutamate 5-kinase [Bdellovibrionales bacterium]|nr:glutamate 5-kinase [Bdellovibrionales bacterium]